MLPISVSMSVRWGEMDAFGHVNNTVFFRWFEDARIALFEHVGLGTSKPTGMAPILASTHCDFLRPVTYPAEVAAHAGIASLGRTSFVMAYTATCGENVVARGYGVVVMVDYATGAKVPLPDELRHALEALLVTDHEPLP